MKRIIAALKEKWPYYFLEIIVIVVGILFAFSLNTAKENWKETRVKKLAEIETLKKIKNDLLVDSLELDWWVNVGPLLAYDTIAYHYIYHSSLENIDSLRKYVYNLNYFFAFSTNTNGYTFINENNMLSNEALRQELTNFYEYQMTKLLEFAEIDKHFSINTFHNFLVNNLPVEADATDEILREIVNNRKFKMHLNISVGMKKELFGMIENCLIVIGALISDIDKEIARLEGQ